MSDQLERAVSAAFPSQTIDTIDEKQTRPGNETGFMTFVDAEPAYVKTATDSTRRLARETAVTRYANVHCPFQSPRVVAANPDGDTPYLATEPMSGGPLSDPWTDRDDRTELLRQVGFAIAGVHETRFERSGVIIGGDADELELMADTWSETLCETIEWRAEDWFSDRFEDVPRRLVETVRAVEPKIDGGTATLLHGDCSRSNIHLDPNGLLDWERALVGDPAFDLTDAVGHLIDQVDVPEEERDALMNALYDGYRERSGSLPDGIDRYRPLYWAIAYLLVPQTFDEWAPTVDQPIDELAEGVREEFDTRLSHTCEKLT
ncbi:phosphotransferase family protein [Haladaptatus sp. DFWS20]|uniref:phosphotransferase family protein n=1 Tax=Haladaptatus sp. DFWS20 TaxID=3403467 RepID=UPI003EBDE6AE